MSKIKYLNQKISAGEMVHLPDLDNPFAIYKVEKITNVEFVIEDSSIEEIVVDFEDDEGRKHSVVSIWHDDLQGYTLSVF